MTAGPRIALVGTGAMGALHARVVSQSDRAELVKVIEPREGAGRSIADRYGATWAPSLDTLSDVDAVILAAPTPLHHGLALDVLRHDTPLLVEKPVCDTLECTEEVLAFAAARDLPLMCGLLERYNPAVATALAILDAPVHLTAVRHSPYVPRIKTGVAWDLLVHDVDLAIRVFGGRDAESVAGSIGHFHPDSLPGAEDVADTVLRFPCGGMANVSASRIGQRKVRALVLHEVHRLIEVNLLRNDVTIHRHVALDTATQVGSGYRQQSIMEIPELTTNAEPLATQLDRFLDLLAGTVDASAERESVLPSHRVVAQLVRDHCLSPI
ncbi:MAG: Gfo/Idh/MocA family protein [Sciscionella sp.]